MGLSTTIGTAFFAIILIAGSAYTITLNVEMMKTTTEPLELFVNTAQAKLSESCQIDSWNSQTSHTIKLNITNTGSEGIRLSRFDNIDVLVTYNTSGVIVTEWFTYDQDQPASNHWAVSSVYTNGDPGDTVNPINLSGNVYGIWDSGETIEIRVYVSDDVFDFNYLKFTLPHGSTFSKAL